MNQVELTEYASGLMHDVQIVRSQVMEGLGLNLEESEGMLANLEPWLFGEKNILHGIARSLDNGVSKQDAMNFAAVVGMCTSLRFRRVINGRTEEPTFREIFADE